MALIIYFGSRILFRRRHHGLSAKRYYQILTGKKDLNENMILLGVIQDSEGSWQHGVTIYRNWVFDSNEKGALPLCQESLDCCTWEVKHGKVCVLSRFVKFIDG